MDHLLGDYELKRGRAMEHFDVLREATQRFSDRKFEAVPGKLNADRTQYTFRVLPEPLDPDWPILLGEFVYDTRASLDYLVTALIRSTGKEEHRGSEFPIYGIDGRVHWTQIDNWWDEDPQGTIVRKLARTPDGTKAAFKELQPFYGVPDTDPDGHPLFQLQELSNRDKHRRLNLLVRNAGFQFVDADWQPVFDGPPVEARITETDERDAYTVALNGAFEGDVGMYLLPTYDVRLDEPPHLIGDLVDTLASINQFIDRRVMPVVRRLLR
jgi:hypothetical protein